MTSDVSGSAEATDLEGSVDDLDFELTDLESVVEPAAPAEPGGAPGGGRVRPPVDPSELSVEALLDDLEAATAERDSHLEDLQRVSAEFANYRKQTEKRQADLRAHAASSLVDKLLPVLDACEAAIAHETEGAGGIGPISQQLHDVLERAGLERLDPIGETFDPESHEAVLHEEGEGTVDGPVVAEVMRTGYAFNGRVLRAAMVKVRG